MYAHVQLVSIHIMPNVLNIAWLITYYYKTYEEFLDDLLINFHNN